MVLCVNMHTGIIGALMVLSWYCQRVEATSMQIRPIKDDDVPAVARLLKVLSRQFIVHESTPEGAATFLRENDADAIRRYIASGQVYHVAECDGQIAGFISIRDRSHLFHLFVDLRWQGQGVARALWQTARRAAIDAGGSGSFTVNSSNFAVPVYEKMGFVRTAPMQSLKGVFFNPMRWGSGPAAPG